jgi:hypothetical protein
MVKPASRRKQRAQAQGEEQEQADGGLKKQQAAPGVVDGPCDGGISGSSATKAPRCALADGLVALRSVDAVPKRYPRPELLTWTPIKVGKSCHGAQHLLVAAILVYASALALRGRILLAKSKCVQGVQGLRKCGAIPLQDGHSITALYQDVL